MRKTAPILFMLLTGCVAPQGNFHYVKDGLLVTDDPKRFETFRVDRAVCDGEAAKSALASQERSAFTHSQNVNLVFQGCMAAKGYVVR